jgi:retron-type reverse transcriptase
VLFERSQEFQLPLWVAAVDFKKAFDTVRHECIWKALRDQGVHETYVSTLAKLYTDQKGQVATDRMSNAFKIGRGTKQGDPISPVLFNAVLEMIVRRLRSKWDQQAFGVDVGQDRLLQNLRFADDVLVTATSLTQLQEMLNDLAFGTNSVGLELHMGKRRF